MSQKSIFISHASQDSQFAVVLAQELQNRGYEALFDMYNLDLGHWQSELEAALAQCQVVLILLSTAALQSLGVRRQIDEILERKKHAEDMLIVPALIESCTIPPRLSDYGYLSFLPGGNHAAQLDLFIDMLEQQLYRQAPPAGGPSPAASARTEPPAGGPVIHNRGENIISGSISGGNIIITQGKNVAIRNTPTRDTDK